MRLGRTVVLRACVIGCSPSSGGSSPASGAGMEGPISDSSNCDSSEDATLGTLDSPGATFRFGKEDATVDVGRGTSCSSGGRGRFRFDPDFPLELDGGAGGRGVMGEVIGVASADGGNGWETIVENRSLGVIDLPRPRRMSRSGMKADSV